MKIKEVKKRSECFVLIFNLVLAIVAFSVLVGLQTEVVSGLGGAGAGSLGTAATGGKKLAGAGVSDIPPAEAVNKKGGIGKIGSFIFGQPKGPAHGVGQGLLWAGVAYAALGWIAPMIGASPETTKALQFAAAAGLGTAGVLRGLGTKAIGQKGILSKLTTGSGPWVSGLVVGVVVFLLMYKKTSYKTYDFKCQPWEAPIGGKDCEKCNDELHACSEYRCKSLGQACELANDEASGYPLCYWANEKDVNSPAIRPWEEVISEGYVYSTLSPRPPGGGFEVVQVGGKKCIEPFTAIDFGIETDKPSQCKIGYNLTTGYGDTKYPPAGYDDMEYYFGGSNLYDYTHMQKMKLPSPDSLQDYAKSQLDENETTELAMDDLTIYNGGYYNLYVRCRSPNGYYNPDPYVIRFCVEEGPDLTPPLIEEFNIPNGSPVQYEIDNLSIIAYTNEPSNCRWSRTDQVYSDMENEMECANEIWQMQDNLAYACTGQLTNVVDRQDNVYYFRCEDQPWLEQADRNRMLTSKKLTLVGTQPLNIKEGSLAPENGSRVTGSTSTMEIEISLETENGYNKGESECYYAFNSEDLDNGRAVEFEATDSFAHSQKLYLISGEYSIFIKCIDDGGNEDRISTTFEAYFDQYPPEVVRVFHNAGKLEIYTNEDAWCYYSTNENTECNYEIGEETTAILMDNPSVSDKTKHTSEWDIEKTYYIKCADVNEKQPNPTGCSTIVKPVDIA